MFGSSKREYEVNENRNQVPKPVSQQVEEIQDEPEEEEEEEASDEGTPAPKKRGRKGRHSAGSTPKGKPGRKPKVPTLKIKFSKRKRTSSVSCCFVFWLVLLEFLYDNWKPREGTRESRLRLKQGGMYSMVQNWKFDRSWT